MTVRVNSLLEPIPGEQIGGEDLTFSLLFDEIREARRHDDPALAQGDWEAPIKQSEWGKVRELCENALAKQSKDMQLAAWYAEAMTRQQGFAGLNAGLQVMDGLLSDFWEFCYPLYDPEDPEERIGKIEWLNRQLPLAIREIPLTAPASGAYSWLKWEESRAVDNLGLKDATARERAVADGKLSGEAFDKAARASGRAFYEQLDECIREVEISCEVFEARVDERFGAEAPSLRDIRQAVAACGDLVGKILERLGGRSRLATEEQEMLENESSAPAEDTAADATAVAAGKPAPTKVGRVTDRADAIRALREAARYFRVNEPHSPVALLAERAASWAEMPFDEWLATVIKDQGTLAQLRELLAIPASRD